MNLKGKHVYVVLFREFNCIGGGLILWLPYVCFCIFCVHVESPSLLQTHILCFPGDDFLQQPDQSYQYFLTLMHSLTDHSLITTSLHYLVSKAAALFFLDANVFLAFFDIWAPLLGLFGFLDRC